MKILLHLCCGPCSIYPIKYLRGLVAELEADLKGHEVVGYFYNPNIHPYKEFKHRLATAREYTEKIGFPLLVDKSYPLEEFIQAQLSDPQGRCHTCYSWRLKETARLAKEQGFDAFTTTLLVSPYQKHELIREIGQEVEQETGVPFHYVDFRSGWDEGVTESKELELYRQPYCGCIFSEKERYYKVKKRKTEQGAV